MVELLLAAVLLASPTESCQLSNAAAGLCDTSGALTDDGARLDGSVTGGGDDENAVDVDEDSGSTDERSGFVCGRRTLLNCELPAVRSEAGSLTLADIASFTADAGTIVTEPNGWAAVGLPFNAISTATTHTVDGTLLGGPATVRFTPVGWRWDFGDGTDTLDTTTGGGTWAAQGLPEFDPTPTSHLYRARGAYRVSVQVSFIAEYRLGTGAWTRIPGVLTLPAQAPTTIRAVTARTVLVAEDCTANPRGPGC